jgi:hypothetical protein
MNPIKPTRDVATLLEALPYIREFHGQTIVIKYGGAAMEDPALCEEFARDVVLLKYVGLNPIVVHGGGPEITEYMERLGLPVEFRGGLRVSDEATVEVAKMVLIGKVNKEIVLRLGRYGQPAVGLSPLPRMPDLGRNRLGLVIHKHEIALARCCAALGMPTLHSLGLVRSEGDRPSVNGADKLVGVNRPALQLGGVLVYSRKQSRLNLPANI